MAVAVALGVSEILIVIILPILILFLIREVVCWYAKINERIGLMKEQNALLKSVMKEMGKTSQSIQELSKKVDGVQSKLSDALKPIVIEQVKKDPIPMVEPVEPVASEETEEADENIENFEVEEEEKSDSEPKETNPYGMKLSNEELAQVEELIKQDMAPGEQVVIHKWNRKVALFGVENWKCTNPTEWFILYEKPE